MIPFLLRIIFLLSIIHINYSKATADEFKIFCFYDSRSFFRSHEGKVTLEDIEPALSNCTHLLYGYAGVSAVDYKLISLNGDLDTHHSYNYFNKVTNLKSRYPHLKVLLSVGGGADIDVPSKYLKLLESSEARYNFVNSAAEILTKYRFDGINLGWQFPPNKAKKPHKTISSIWHKIKKTVVGETLVDEKHEEHKRQFVKLVEEMSQKVAIITASVLPNVKSSLFFDYLSLMPYLDYIILHTYDFNTPYRNPKIADYSIPLYQVGERYSELNVDAVVRDWTKNLVPYYKLIIAVPTFGRVWKIPSKSTDAQAIPPLEAEGEGIGGPITNVRGLRSYYELCKSFILTTTTAERYLSKYIEPDSKCGPYAARASVNDTDYGEWISYEDPEDITIKAVYVRDNKLGGMAIVDLTLDDFNGFWCTGKKFPLVQAVANQLK